MKFDTFFSGILGIKELYALNTSLVSKVIVYYPGTSNFVVSDVVDGDFNVLVDRNSPVGMVFSDANGYKLGYLSLQNGIESIPLNIVEENISSVDLQTLSSTADIVEPEHNPIGNEINMNTNDIFSYAFSNSTFASVIQNPDVDGDNVVDAINGKFYRYFLQYGVRAGSFSGSNLTPDMSNPVVVDSYRLNVVITDNDLNFPAQISYTGPVGSGLQNTSSESMVINDSKTVLYSSPCMQGIMSPPVVPPSGVYYISYKNKVLNFNIYNQNNVIKYQAICVPTVSLNQDGTINKINWEYRLSDNSGNIDPKILIKELILQIDKIGAVRVYNSPKLTALDTEHILTDQTISWILVDRIYMAYNDIFGNHVVVTWDKN